MLPYLLIRKLLIHLQEVHDQVVDEPRGHQLYKPTPYYKMTSEECIEFIRSLNKTKADKAYEGALKLNLLREVQYHERLAMELTPLEGQNYLKPLGVVVAYLRYNDWFYIILLSFIAAVFAILAYTK
jgi:hypothetical protein